MDTESTGSPELLRVQNLRVTYGKGDSPHVAVRGASFSMAPGERIAIVGESGSGKTTLALAVAGLLTAATATITFDALEFAGVPVPPRVARTVPRRTPDMAMVFQDAMTSLDPVASIGGQFRDVLRGIGKARRSEITAQAKDWLRRVGLHEVDRILRLRPYELSGGMRQRVMVALAVCSVPKLLIADEPTSALDASVSRDVMDLLMDMTQVEQAGLLVVSHDIELCRRYVDRVIVMYHGEIVDICRAAHIEQDATHPYTTALTACVPTLESATLDWLPTLDEALVGDRAAAVPA